MHRKYSNPPFRICARGNFTRPPSHGVAHCRPLHRRIGLNALFRAVLEPIKIQCRKLMSNFCLSPNKKKQWYLSNVDSLIKEGLDSALYMFKCSCLCPVLISHLLSNPTARKFSRNVFASICSNWCERINRYHAAGNCQNCPPLWLELQ